MVLSCSHTIPPCNSLYNNGLRGDVDFPCVPFTNLQICTRSREIRPAPSLHRASTDALIMVMTVYKNNYVIMHALLNKLLPSGSYMKGGVWSCKFWITGVNNLAQ